MERGSAWISTKRCWISKSHPLLVGRKGRGRYDGHKSGLCCNHLLLGYWFFQVLGNIDSKCPWHAGGRRGGQRKREQHPQQKGGKTSAKECENSSEAAWGGSLELFLINLWRCPWKLPLLEVPKREVARKPLKKITWEEHRGGPNPQEKDIRKVKALRQCWQHLEKVENSQEEWWKTGWD